MKKLFIIMLMLISTLTLSACDLLGGDVNEVIDNARNIAETFTVEDQTIEIGTEEYDWAAYVEEVNDNLPDDITIEVVEDNIDYGTPGTYTVTIRLTAPDVDFTHTFNVTVVEGGTSPGDIIAGFDGDVTYLQNLMDPVLNSDAKETVTTLVFDVNEMDYMTGDTIQAIYSVESTSRVIKGEEMDLMSQDITISANGEMMAFSFYMVREDTSLTFYMETAVLETIVGEWDEALTEELGITEDYIMFTVEGNFARDEDLNYASLVEGLGLYLHSFMSEMSDEEILYVEAQIDYVISNVDLFAKYLTLEYYMNQEGMTAQLDTTDNDEIMMTMTMAPTMYGVVLNDFITDLQTFASGLDDVEVPDIKSMPEYQQIMTILEGLQPMQMDALFDPANPTELSFSIDLTTFANTLAMMAGGGEMPMSPVNSLTINVVVKTNAEVMIPENASDMDPVIRNIAKLMFVESVYYNMSEIVYYSEWYRETPLPAKEQLSLAEIITMMSEDLYYYDETMAQVFDLDLSYIENRGTIEAPEYYIYLVWADGQDVFVEEVNLENLENLLSMETTIIPIIDLVNDEAFDYAKLALLVN